MAEPILFDPVEPIKSKRVLCNKCGKQMHHNQKGEICTSCKEICHCGKPKDCRADTCISCSNSRNAKANWANPKVRKRMVDSLILGGQKRRTKYDDLTLESFSTAKSDDGRLYAWFWGEDGKKHTVYRYQWVWEQANGPITDTHQIHHKDKNCTNDELSNLELLTSSDHQKLHVKDIKGKSNAPWWICQWCGISFQKKRREGIQPRKFCSRGCKNSGFRKARRF
jgi:hypothetical protein